MSQWHLRPMTPADYPQLLTIANRISTLPLSLEEYIRRVEQRFQEGPFLRLVAEEPGGRICGYGTVFHPVWRAEGVFHVHAAVDPDCQGQGLGRTLYAAAEREARERGARSLTTDVRDDLPAARSFAERRGFRVTQHQFQSQLDLAEFDPSPFLHAISEAEAMGYRFISMAEADDAEGRHRLFALDEECSLDEPGADPGARFTFDDYARHVFAEPVYDPAGAYVAVLGDEWAAMSGLHFLEGTDEALVFFTGVRRAHRGKRLAQALKLLTARYALQRGMRRISTANNERNPSMLAVNRKFGFKPLPGGYIMERDM